MLRIVVIGASSGIGKRVAADFAKAGCIVGAAARSTDRLEELKRTCPENITTARIDVTDNPCVEQFYNLIETIGGMDILLFASGTGFCDPELIDDKLDITLRTNVIGFARITTAAYKYFKQTANRKPGQIAAITSVAGAKGIGVSAAYSASKKFQQTFINALEQLAYQQQVNVKFTDIRPGFIRTPILDPSRSYPMIMTLDYAVPLIEAAILKRRRIATIDSRWAIVNCLWRLIPQRVWRHISLHW